MSVQEFKALARKHWEEWLPEKWAALKAEGKLNEALNGAALLAQDQYEHWLPQIGPEGGEGNRPPPVHPPGAGSGRSGRGAKGRTRREGTPVPEEPAGVAGRGRRRPERVGRKRHAPGHRLCSDEPISVGFRRHEIPAAIPSSTF